jgi:hypothetical protein
VSSETQHSDRDLRGDPPEQDRLDSWKEIASYLHRSDKTVRRWEHTLGLPVHRLPHQSRASVYALKSELDAWWQQCGDLANGKAGTSVAPRRRPLSDWPHSQEPEAALPFRGRGNS